MTETQETNNVKFHLSFAQHLTDANVSSVITAVGSYGNVSPTGKDRSYVVEVFRQSKVQRLKERLEHFERWGLVSWKLSPKTGKEKKPDKPEQ